MALYVQHGHGKSDKITRALSAEVVDGVVLSARNEKLDNLDRCIAELRDHEDCEVLLDPQFFVCSLSPAKDGYLPEEYSAYYTPGRSADDFIRGKANREFARATLDFEIARGVDRLISPTVMFDSFADRWCQIALTLADASMEHHAGLDDPPPLLVAFVLHENALSDKEDLDRFLDTVTKWDVDGFYLIIERSDPTYSQRFDDGHLAHLMYLVHVLGDRNGYRVVCGYSDFVGILLRAVGATAFATGWYQTLRQFHRKAFLQRKPGGQPPRDRYSSSPLMSSIFLGELESIDEIGELERVLSGVALDDVIRGASSPQASTWNRPTSEMHHWQTLGALDQELTGRSRSDIQDVLQKLREAQGLYKDLERGGVSFERVTNGDHLGQWIRAIRQFRELVRI